MCLQAISDDWIFLTPFALICFQAAAMTSGPTRLAELKRIIEDMRLYLRKMHGRDRPPVKLG